MGKFLRTLLIGIGIGLLIAPKRGEEMRQLLMERFQGITGSGSSTGSTSSGQSPTSSSTPSSSQSSTSSSSDNAASSQLKQFAETAEEHTMMYTPPTTGTYEPAFPDYTNPEQK